MNTQGQFVRDSFIEGIHVLLVHINKNSNTPYVLRQYSESYYCITKDDLSIYASDNLSTIFAFLRGMIYILDTYKE